MIERTWLFTPGDDARKLARAARSLAHVLIVDWEDGVDQRRKNAARTTSARLFRTGGATPGHARDGAAAAAADRDAAAGSRRRVGVRINAPGTAHHTADLDAVASLRPDFVMLPKVEDPSALEPASRLAMPVIALIESARGVEALRELSSAATRLERFAFGALDFCLDVGAEWRPDNALLDVARARLVIASRAADLAQPLDSVFPVLSDADGLRREAARACAAGFAGKMVVHPEQIGPVATAFTPDDARLERARRIMAAFREAREQATAVMRVDGSFVDAPGVAWARRILEEAGEPPGG